jgi:hypothetical protein
MDDNSGQIVIHPTGADGQGQVPAQPVQGGTTQPPSIQAQPIVPDLDNIPGYDPNEDIPVDPRFVPLPRESQDAFDQRRAQRLQEHVARQQTGEAAPGVVPAATPIAPNQPQPLPAVQAYQPQPLAPPPAPTYQSPTPTQQNDGTTLIIPRDGDQQ